MASTLPETPSLLREQCLQYLIAHLEDIPVEALALLPTAIRRTLAVHLPVADVLQLEQTRFASGLDMPGVWKEVCEIRHLLSRYPKLKELFESEIEAKEFVMMVVAYEALHQQKSIFHHDHGFLAKPPRTPGPPHIRGPPVFFSRVCIETPLKVPHFAVPSRFLTMHQNRFDGSILKLLRNRHHVYLERFYIDCSSCVGVAGVMEVLPRLKQLTISCFELDIESDPQFSYLHSLLHVSGCSQSLHTITLDDCPDDAISMIVPTLASVCSNSPANFQSLRHLRITVSSVERNRGYCGNYWIWVAKQTQEALLSLCKVIQTHTALHSCSFRQWPGMNDHDILGSICSLFEQPQFQCLTLTETSLFLENIQHLVHTFLNTPCNGPQILKLERIHIYGKDDTAPSNCDSNFLLHKSLELHCHIPSLYSSLDHTAVQSSLKQWLSTVSKLQLHSLTVTNDYHSKD